MFFRVAAVAALYSSTFCAAQELPTLSADPALTEAFSVVKQILPVVSAQGFTTPPDLAKPWPCAVTELQLRTYSGALSEQELDKQTQRSIQRALRDSTAAQKVIMSYNNVSSWPIVASCVNGQLSGALDFVINYTQVMETAAIVTTTPYKVRVQTDAVPGDTFRTMNSPTTLTMSTDGGVTKYKDPAVQANMEKHKAPPTPTLTITRRIAGTSVANMNSVAVIRMGTPPTATFNTLVVKAIDEERNKISLYIGKDLFTDTPQRNRSKHGLERRYAIKMGNVDVPGEDTCWEDGEQIKTTQCDVR